MRFENKIVRVRFDDGRTEIVSEEAMLWAKRLEPFASDPAYKPGFDLLIVNLEAAAAIRNAAKNL